MEPMLRDEQIRATIAEGNVVSILGQKCPRIPSHANLANRGEWFALMARSLWAATATAALFDLVGQHLGHKDDRTCRRWARGESEPPMSVLWLLLRSREGGKVIAFIQNHEPPSWWVETERLTKRGQRLDAFMAENGEET